MFIETLKKNVLQSEMGSLLSKLRGVSNFFKQLPGAGLSASTLKDMIITEFLIEHCP